jgi:hypothetical protein
MVEEDIVDKVFDKIMQDGFDVHRSPLAHKVVVMVTTAQGVIDNGGFDYFFEQSFAGEPDYQEFVTVYNEIGAFESAGAIEQAIQINLHQGVNSFEDLDSVMFENSEADRNRLKKYVEKNFV